MFLENSVPFMGFETLAHKTESNGLSALAQLYILPV